MGSAKNPKRTNIANAGAEDIEQALEDAVNEGTQAQLDEFSQKLDGKSVKERIDGEGPTDDNGLDPKSQAQEDTGLGDSDYWDDVVADRAEETETQYEQEIDSRAENYNEEEIEALEEGEEIDNIDTGPQGHADISESRGERTTVEMANESPDVADEVGERGEYDTIDRTEPVAKEDIEYVDDPDVGANEENTVENLLGSDRARVEGDAERLQRMIGDETVTESDFYDKPEDVFDPSEPDRGKLPESKQIEPEPIPEDEAKDDSHTGAVGEESFSNEEVTGIAFDDIEPPESGDHIDQKENEVTGAEEQADEIAARGAYDELTAEEVVDRHNKGESPFRAQQETIDAEPNQSSKRSWRGEETGSSPGRDHLNRFVPADEASTHGTQEYDPDTSQSATFHEKIARKQAEKKLENHNIPGNEKVAQDSVMDYDSNEYNDPFDAITSGETVLDETVSPADPGKEISASTVDPIGERAAESIKEAGFSRVGELSGMRKDELTQFDGVGERKAERIMQETAAGDITRRSHMLASGELAHKDFSPEDYQEIFTYSAKHGLDPEETEEILTSGDVQKEIPGPTAITNLSPGDNARKQRTNWNIDKQTATKNGTETTDTYRPTNTKQHSETPPVEVRGTVKRALEPADDNIHQSVILEDHNGNTTKFSIFGDSMNDPNAGNPNFSSTNPEDGVHQDVILEPGDEITIENPQINDYQGDWDGNTLSSVPETTIKGENGTTTVKADTHVPTGKGHTTRGGAKMSKSAEGKIDLLPGGESPDYEDKSRNLRRRERRHNERQDNNTDRGQTEGEQFSDNWYPEAAEEYQDTEDDADDAIDDLA
jgi:hypothetical protein